MSQLDELAFLTQKDPLGMGDLTAGFADQCRQAVIIAQAAPLPNWTALPDHVVLTGLGGSAAGGDLASALFTAQGKVPFLVNREYSMPAYVGSASLVFACSYSGNTEETLSAYEEAKLKGASIIVVSSGGEITERAKRDGFPYVTVPGGQPPRTAMGYMLMPVIVASEQLGLIPKQDFVEAFSMLDSVREDCGFDSPFVNNEAKQIAGTLNGRLGVLYGTGHWQYALAQRWRGQLNENSKVMVSTHVFPELCHNEILGWEGSGDQGVEEWVTYLLEGGDESERFKSRIKITCEQIGNATSFHRVVARGEGLLAKMLSLAHVGDWVSLYLAALTGKDPGQMVAIDRLKEELVKL